MISIWQPQRIVRIFYFCGQVTLVNAVLKCQCAYMFPGFLPSSGVLTAASVYAKSPVLTSAVQLMVELCLFTGLGKRKRVMDEKELMMPLELGYVQAAEKRKALIKKFTSECVGSFCHSRDHIATHMATNVRHTLLL